jgi:transcriptional regulator with XRE-family HTH domain
MSETTSIRLKRIMEERNLKQSDILAKAQPFCEKYNVKLGKSDLSQFVSGKVTPGQWKLTILGLALNVSEAWLMGLDVPMERKKDSISEAPKIDKNLQKS